MARTKLITDQELIRAIKKYKPDFTVKELCFKIRITPALYYKRVRTLKEKGLYPDIKQKQQPRKQAGSTLQIYKEVDPISDEHAAELLNRASKNVDFWKTVASKADRVESCDWYSDRVGGEL